MSDFTSSPWVGRNDGPGPEHARWHSTIQDLDELELLVKGALQCVKDTDIHENIEPVDLNHILELLAEPYLPFDETGGYRIPWPPL